jgi:hypothetical protein
MIRLKKSTRFKYNYNNISTELYLNLLQNTKKSYTDVLDKKKRIIGYDYIFVNQFAFDTISIDYVKIQTDYGPKIVKKIDFDEDDVFNILKYKPFNSVFFNVLELLHKFDLIVDKKEDILELSGTPIFFEAILYYEKKYSKTISNYHLIYFDKYNFTKDKEDKKIQLQFYTQYLKGLKTETYNGFLDNDFLNLKKENNKNKKYDKIISNLSNNLKDYGEDFIEHANIQLIFSTFLFSATRLKSNGSLVLVVNSITTKSMADLVLIGKKIFKEVNLYQPKIHIKFKKSGTCIIMIGFNEKKFQKYKKQLFEIYKSMLKNNPTFDNFNIEKYDPQLEDILSDKITKPIVKNKNGKFNYKYIDSFLDLDSSDSRYDFIREFNEKRYYDSNQYVENMIKLKLMSEKERKEYLKEYKKTQYIRSILWAKEFDMDVVSYYEKGFKDDFGKLIVKDLFSYHEHFEFHFKKSNINVDLIPISKEIHQLVNKFDITAYMIDTRDPDIYDNMKDFVRYYKPKHRSKEDICNLQLGRYIINKVGMETDIPNSQAWIKMYEMISLFNIVNKKDKKLKSFHLCELPGGFIKAINNYIFTKTKIEKFEWNAQSLHPGIKGVIKNFGQGQKGLYDKYPNKWHWGEDKTGDITNPKNIKSYKKYCKDVKLITSDCGLGMKSEDKKLMKVDFCYIVAILHLLEKGGNCCAKFVIPVQDNIIISAIYLLYLHFDEIIFYKSVQNTYSGEFYIIGKGFQGIDKKTEDTLFKTIDNYSENIDLFGKYSEEFIIQLESALSKLTNIFTFAIDRQLYYVDNYEYIEKCYMEKIDGYILEKNKDWFKKFKPTKIKNKKNIL